MISCLTICVTDKLNGYLDKCTNIHDRPACYEHHATGDYNKFVHFISHARNIITGARNLNAYVYGSKSKYIMDEDCKCPHTPREYRNIRQTYS